MNYYDVFNGDADGICALLQLRKAAPREATLVTGVKRDFRLLERVDASAGDQITVLDVSMDKNRHALRRVLADGAEVFYVDHHFAGKIPANPRLHAIINEAADVCTAVLVNGHLKGAYPDWAIVGAFGDNLQNTAHSLARQQNIAEVDLDALKKLGIYLNYNAYGQSIEDLHVNPGALYQTLYEAGGALEFVASSADYKRLRDGYQSDMEKAAQLRPVKSEDNVAVFMLPSESWSLRVRGVFGNDLALQYPNRAHAVITEKANGNYLVSVRAPLNNKQGASELCRQFPSGGGRAAAAGIKDLPREELAKFMAAFADSY